MASPDMTSNVLLNVHSLGCEAMGPVEWWFLVTMLDEVESEACMVPGCAAAFGLLVTVILMEAFAVESMLPILFHVPPVMLEPPYDPFKVVMPFDVVRVPPSVDEIVFAAIDRLL
ncbi:MAG: hypothetical protein PHN45_00025 [Methylococcales bacterium]|nr:hypothetical protein [Methylococcales bacterium]